MTTTPFGMVEKAVKELIEAKYAPAADHTGGDLAYNGTDDLYVWISLVPGGGTDEINGEWIVDIDCFSTTYGKAMGHALALEALLIGSRHITETMRLDNCYQNSYPAERPWDDDSSYRVGGTYVFTARRRGSA